MLDALLMMRLVAGQGRVCSGTEKKRGTQDEQCGDGDGDGDKDEMAGEAMSGEHGRGREGGEGKV